VRSYLIATFALSVLLVLVHTMRLVLERPHVTRDPWFVEATVVAVVLAVWAWRLLRRLGNDLKPGR
jgi:hypothetical protein